MVEKTIAQEIKALEARCPEQSTDPEGYRLNIEQRAGPTDTRRMYQAATGWKVA